VAGLSLPEARALLARAERVVVLTGAGVSAASGVPTFRGRDGLWGSFRAEDLATPEAFARDPGLVWAWYLWRRGLVAACAPNAAHRALARYALARAGVRLVTQNVDGLHERAAREAAGPDGAPGPALPVTLHGSLFRDRCTACVFERDALPAAAPGSTADPRPKACTEDGPPTGSAAPPPRLPEHALPRCPDCGALLRPGVVWFGEALPAGALEAAARAARRAEVCVVAGTSALVHPAASLPLETLRAGGVVIEVNPAPTPLSRVAALALRAGAEDALPELLGV